ncbi:MAG: TPM domain-containing protein [Gemmatimonadota bacterium]
MRMDLDKSFPEGERKKRHAGQAVAAWAKGIGLGVLLQLLAISGFAQQSGIHALFPAQSSEYVTDLASVVDPASKQAMTDLIRRLRSATGAVIVVVTLPTIGDYPASDVALEIGRTWKVGEAAEVGDQRRNAGLVILLVPRREGQSGRVEMSVGTGLEGIITDATSGRIQDQIVPALREGRYGPALAEAVALTASQVAGGFGVTDSALTAARLEEPSRQPVNNQFSRLLPIIILIIVVALMSRRGGRGGRGGGRGGGFGPGIFWGGMGGWGGGGGGWGGGFGGGGGGGFGGFGGGGGFSGGGGGRSF